MRFYVVCQYPTKDELTLWGKASERSDPKDVIAWSLAIYGPYLTLGTGFGASGMVLLDLVMRAHRAVDVFFLDTRLLFPDTYALRERIEARYGIKLRAVSGLSLAEQETRFGPRLWEQAPDLCCSLRKVEPLSQVLAGRRAWMTALRRDQSKTRQATPVLQWDERRSVAKIAPLARWTEQDCWAYIHHHDLPYNPLHDQGYPSIGCQPCTRAVRPGEDLRAGRWAGHAHKTERGLHWENGRVTRAATAAQAAPVGPAAYTQHPGHVRARASGYRSRSGRVFSGADPGRRAGRDRPSPAAEHPRAGRNMTTPAGCVGELTSSRGGERTSSHV